MKKNRSPWLHQLQQDRKSVRLTEDISVDVAIIGAGIAGIASAFYVLKHTDKKVAMFERFKLAHGATGHNAGQVVSYFERGFASLVEEFGLEKARDGQQAVENAWALLDEMYTDAGLNIPFSRFIGHAGLSSYDQVLLHLKNNALRKEAGLNTETIRIAEEVSFAKEIPEEFAELYTCVPKSEIQELLETSVENFVAVLSYQKGCVNSALFCEEILHYLERKYPERFSLFEHTPINKVILREADALLDGGVATVNAHRVVLATNGFETITLINDAGLALDSAFHHMIAGKIGYMSGYLEKMDKSPIAISYFTEPGATFETAYFYLTRRPYEYEPGAEYNLISVGGPDAELDERGNYSHEDEYPDDMEGVIDSFVRNTYELEPNKKIDYVFTWHGLMGYTKNGVRLIGPAPENPVLLYNLGCNGIGILPSLHGGEKIARIIGGEILPSSIFDAPTA